VIKLPNAPAEWVAKSLYRRGTVKVARDDSNGAVADFTGVIDLPNAPAKVVAKAGYRREIITPTRHAH